MHSILITSVGGPPGRNTLLSLLEAKRYSVVVADADPFAVGIYEEQIPGYVVPRGDAPAFVAAILKIIEKHSIRVVVPCIEPDVLALAKNQAAIRAAGAEILVPPLTVLQTGLHKGRATTLAVKSGSLAPRTLCLSPGQYSRDEVLDFLKGLDTGAVVKPSVSYGMKGVLITSEPNEALYYLDQLEVDAVVQERIPGASGSMHMVGLIYDGHGRAQRKFVSRSIRTLFENGGPATGGITVHEPDLVERSIAVLEEIGEWRGPAGVEWIMDPRDGLFKFIEINPRLWGYSSLTTGSGTNFAEALVELALGHELTPDPGYGIGIAMLRTIQDVIIKTPTFPIPSASGA